VNVWDRVTQQQWVGARTAQAILLQGYFPAAAAAATAATTACPPLVMTSTTTATTAATIAVSSAPAACTVTTKPTTTAATAVPALSLPAEGHTGTVLADAVHTAAAVSFEEQLQALELGDSPLSSPLHSAASQRHQQQQQQQQQSYTNSASYNNTNSSSSYSSSCYSSTGRDSEPCLGTLLLDFLHLFSHEFEAGSEGLSVRGGGFRFPLDCGLSHPQASDPIVIEVRSVALMLLLLTLCKLLRPRLCVMVSCIALHIQ
jgi:Cid1 family poly A polymerase